MNFMAIIRDEERRIYKKYIYISSKLEQSSAEGNVYCYTNCKMY